MVGRINDQPHVFSDIWAGRQSQNGTNVLKQPLREVEQISEGEGWYYFIAPRCTASEGGAQEH